MLDNDPKEGQWHALSVITELADRGVVVIDVWRNRRPDSSSLPDVLIAEEFLRKCVKPVVRLVCNSAVDETRALAATTLLSLSRLGERC